MMQVQMALALRDACQRRRRRVRSIAHRTAEAIYLTSQLNYSRWEPTILAPPTYC